MITEFVKRLRKHADTFEKSGLSVDGIVKDYRESADVIEELSAKLQSANMERSSQYYNGDWIPVSERLPKIAGVYRVTRYYPNNVMNPNYLVGACCFDGSNTWYNDNRINHERAYADNVIAWQENPEPFEPHESEEEE